MKTPSKNECEPSEFRQDIVSGDWVLIAAGRKKRPRDLVIKEKREAPSEKSCPFENPQASGNAAPVIVFPENSGANWEIQVIPNLYPAVCSDKGVNPAIVQKGPYFTAAGAGYHDLIITRNHKDNFPALSPEKAADVFKIMQRRYKEVSGDERMRYVSIFHNWGASAGASIYHPHYQMISIPVIPPDVSHSLNGSKNYFSAHKLCVHCSILEREIKDGSRIIFENSKAVAFLPFVSREPFEIRIFPKDHHSFFEDAGEDVLSAVVEALQQSLRMLKDKLREVDYIFFIHTAPVKDKREYAYYHWHIEVQPKISISAGFELGTGIEITVVDPDDAAEFLKESR